MTNVGDTKLNNVFPNFDLTYNLGSSTLSYENIIFNVLRLQGPSSNPSVTEGTRIEFITW